MIPPVKIEVKDYRPVIRSVAMELDARITGALTGIANVAVKIQRRAISNAAQKHYSGRLEENIDWWESFRSPTYVRYSVGIRGNKFVPEGKTFEVGWRSKKNLQRRPLPWPSGLWPRASRTPPRRRAASAT